MRLRQAGADQAGADGIEADLVRTEFVRGGMQDAEESRLGRVVRGEPSLAVVRIGGRGEDDCTPAPRFHPGGCCLNRLEDARQIDGQNAVPDVLWDVREFVLRDGTRIRD